MPKWGEVFKQGAEKYWEDKVPTGFPEGSQVSATGAPPPKPPEGEQFPQNWDNLSATERWLYTKGLPWAEETGWLDRLENLNETWVGKALQVVDVLAEGVERSVGLVAQYKDAVAKEKTGEFFEEFGSAWRAGSMTYDVMGAPGLAVTQTGGQTYDPLDINEDALAEARQMIVDGSTTEEARASLYTSMGSLAMRAQLADAVGHILLDPANYILPKVAPITRLHKLRADAIYKSGRVGTEAVAGARIVEATAFEALDAARKAGAPLSDSGDLLRSAMAATEAAVEAEAAAAKAIGEATFSPMQRFAIWATGGLPLSPETAAKWAASGPKGWGKALPWNWFKLTPMARANEVLVNVGVHGQALVTQARSVEDIVSAFNRGVSGALGDQVGHIMVTPAGRSAQGWMKYSAADVNNLHAGWKATTVQRDQLHAAARLLNTSADDLMTRLVKGEAKLISGELIEASTKLGDDVPLAVRSLAESMQSGHFTTDTLESIGKILQDKPFSVDTFKYAALQSVWESTSKTAVVQLGIKEAGWFTRMTSSLKTIETLAFLRLNPGYAVRNFLNNEITMLARGNWGAWESSNHLMKMWDRIGVSHPRLTAGFGAAGAQTGELAAKKASTLIDEAFQSAQSVLGDAAQGQKNWVGKQLDKISGAKFPGDMGEYAKSAESWASIRSMSKGYMEGWSWFWKPKAPGAFGIADLPDDVSKNLQNWARGAMNEAELDAMLVADDLNISMATVLDDAAERIGIGVEQIDDVFGYGFRETLADELLPAIRSRNAEEVESVLRAARERHVGHMQNLLEEGWENAYKGNLELMQVDGPGGVLRSWGETAGHEFGMWEGHLKSVNEDTARIRALPVGERGPAWEVAKARWDRGWNNYYKWYSKRMKGMVDGAKKAGVPIPDTVLKSVDDRLAGIKKFHQRKNRLSKKFFGTDFKGDTLAKEQAWATLSDELNSMYSGLMKEQLNLSKIVDDGMAASVPGPLADTYGAWRLKVRNARQDYMVEMRAAYVVANDDAQLAALGVSKQQFFDEFVSPMRASHQQVIYKLEQRGKLALGGDNEQIAFFSEGAARLLRESSPEDIVRISYRRPQQEVVRLIEERGPPIPQGATPAQSSAIETAAQSVEHSSRIAYGPAGSFRLVDVAEDIQVPLFRTSSGKVFTYEADSLADATRAYASAITEELSLGGLDDTGSLMSDFVRTAEDEIAAAKLLESTKPSSKPFFPDTASVVKEQPEIGLTTNELWMRDGARIYDAIGDSSKKLIDEPPMKFADLDPAQQIQLRGYVDALKGEMGQSRSAAMYMAEFKRDAALLNYARRTNFDSFVGQMFPFAFWTTHSMYNWALWMVERPAVMATYLRLRKLFETAKGRPNLPRRMKGMGFGFKTPFIGKNEEWMGPLFINPLKIGLPIDNFVYPFERMAQDKEDDRARAARQLERQRDDGEITEEQYLNAIQTQSGQEWRDAMTQTANGKDNWMDFSMYLMAPHAPAIWAYNAARGRDFAPGPFLPITRTIKGITAMMGVTQGGQEGGWNIERAVRKELGLPEFDAFDDYRVDRMLANMAADGTITADQNLRAVIEREGPIFQEAQRRAGLEFGVRAAASALGIPAMAYPPGEEKSRNLADAWGDAYEAWKTGGTAQLVEFYEEHPEVKGRLGLFDSPEERVTRFLVDNVNDVYYSSPSLIKSQIREALGEEFVTNFLATDTRDPMAISPEILAMWLKVIGGDPPGSLGDDALPIQMATQDVAYRAEAFYSTRRVYFPNYFDEQEDYYKLDKAAQKAYRADHPSLVQYWDWKWDWLHRNPDVAPYLTEKNLEFPSEQALREAEAAQPSFGPEEWRQVLGLPAYELTLDVFDGEPMPPVLQERLEELALQMGLSGWEDVVNRIELAQPQQ